ncbi:MAG: hypothetical protein JHC93_01965 [Parachlamydiales bacterium]|nr:hypothetical protein [Parachlamydiales bacterium]
MESPYLITPTSKLNWKITYNNGREAKIINDKAFVFDSIDELQQKSDFEQYAIYKKEIEYEIWYKDRNGILMRKDFATIKS